MLILLLWSCASSPDLPSALQGGWVVRGSGLLGEVVLAEDCRIGLWGEAWASPGEDLVECALEESEGWAWLHFPLVMGAGEGQAVLGLSPDRQRAQLPLGVREGEHLLSLDVQEGSLEAGDRKEAWSKSEERIASAKEEWKAGTFQVYQDERLVGDFQLLGEGLAQIAVYDPFWMTEGRTSAVVIEEGPDLVLAFSAMPSFEGEPAVLRINRPTSTAVAPMGDLPMPADRRFRLEGGVVEPGLREAAVVRALQEGGEREKVVMVPLLRDLAASLNGKGRSCPALPALEDPWKLLLVGYEIHASVVGERCTMTADPLPVQHGRRLSFRVLPGGEIESWLREIELGIF